MTLTSSRIVFLGAGNMAEAIINGLLDNGIPTANVLVTDINQDRLDYFQKQFSVCGSKDNSSAVEQADIVVLAVKPQFMSEVLAGVKHAIPSTALVISIAAGLTAETLEAQLQPNTRLVRVMPNTPALVKEGIAGVAPGNHATQADLELSEALLKSVGRAERVEERELDALTAVSGSGPAYVFYLMEAMINAGEELGLAPELARELTISTVSGAAKLMRETGLSATELRERVTSKGGTTAAAIARFEEGDARKHLHAGVIACHARSIELSKGNG